jgi:hypothetical protein
MGETIRIEAPPKTIDGGGALTSRYTAAHRNANLTAHKSTEISQTLAPRDSVWPTCMMGGPLDDWRGGSANQSRLDGASYGLCAKRA